MSIYRLLGRLPPSALGVLSGAMYIALWYFPRYRHATVRDNLKASFPQKSSTELKHLAKQYYRHLALLAAEILAADNMSENDFRQQVTLRNPHLLAQVNETSAGRFIVLSIHQGNWEWMLHGIRAHSGITLDPVYKPLHNSSANKFMLQIRERFGAQALMGAEVSGQLLRKRNTQCALAILADQSPTSAERTVWTQFFARKTAFHAGFAELAIRGGFPVLFAQCRQLSSGRYDIEFHPLGEPPYTATDVQNLVLRYAKMSQTAIKSQPHTWLWSNRRWKRTAKENTGKNFVAN